MLSIFNLFESGVAGPLIKAAKFGVKALKTTKYPIVPGVTDAGIEGSKAVLGGVAVAPNTAMGNLNNIINNEDKNIEKGIQHLETEHPHQGLDAVETF